MTARESREAAGSECPACGGKMIARKSWLSRCHGCGYYGSALPPGAGTGIEGLRAVRQENFERIIDRLERHRLVGGTRLLEVGCAQGLFLKAAACRGARVRGIEPEAPNANLARSAGFDVDSGFFPRDLSDTGPYDFVVFNDVFEHLPSPDRALQSVERILRPGGVAILNLPTSDGALYKTARLLDRVGFPQSFDRMWQRGLPSPHVSYFNEDNLVSLARTHTGLQLLDSMRLVAVARAGLYDRVTSVNAGPKGDVLFAGAWLFSFVAGLFPGDIMALFFVRPDA